MKKVLLTVAMLIGVSAATFANDDMAILNLVDADLTVKSMANLKFLVKATNVETKAIVEIKDADGVVVFKEAVKSGDDYTKVFDLSALPDGSYSFVLFEGDKTTTKSFEIATEVKRTVSL